MNFISTTIPGVFKVLLERHADDRGSFARTFCEQEFAEAGLETRFVQANTSVSRRAGTLRGMHFQRPPHAETKLIRCVRGAIHDVIADVRPASPAFRRWEAFTLDAPGDAMLYVPAGCAHGFQTLADDTEVTYLMSASHAPGHADGFRHDDPAFSIPWPRPVSVIAPKDLTWPPFGTGRR